MEQLLEHKKTIFLVFIIGFCLSIMALYQTYAYDINSNELPDKRSNPDIKYTFNLTNNLDSTYTINLEPGETKLLELTLENNNNYNLKYLLYTTKEIEENTILGTLDGANTNSGVIFKNSSSIVNLVAVNKTERQVTYEISYLTGYENGGDLTSDNITPISAIYSFPNTPVLDDNMVPIVYDEDLSTWVTADTTNTSPKYYWYEYALGRWANVAIIDNNTILDISNHENTGKTNNVIVKDGVAQINENNAFINCGLSNYNFEDSITVAIKSKINVLNGTTTILDNGNFSLYISEDGYLASSITVGSQTYTFKSDYKLSINEWHTIVMTYNEAKIKLYVDGNNVNTNDGFIKGNITPSSNPITLGNNNYNGEIDDIIIIDESLKEEDINTYLSDINSNIVLNNLNNIILYYDFNKGANIVPGTIIKDSTNNNNLEIKAFYTWIPRYKYKVWNIEKQSGKSSITINNNVYNPYNNGIDIIFEDNTSTTGKISCTYNNIVPSSKYSLSEICTGDNGEYYTHPAFTLGNKELTGLWISKYELSLDDNENIIIKNNMINNTQNYDLSTMWNIVNNMTKENNIYSFTAKLDSHLIKNIEWAGVAYLSNSRYGLCSTGICNNIGINNYLSNNKESQTGCGSSNREITNTCNNYNTKEGMTASTTGNIYGVYDMSGGSNEYVLSNIGNTIANIDLKYYDTYPSINTNSLYSQESYNRSRLGDAIGEISLNTENINNGWYNSKLELGTNNQYLLRGGTVSQNSSQFSLSTDTTIVGYRGVLTENQ